jgi:NAD(P)H-flavin reductase/hemoglobin-like flavoprotein
MARRSDSPADTMSPQARRAAPAAAGGDQRLAWWRLRTWRKDLDALTRLRDGLQALDLAAESGTAAATDGRPGEPAGAAETAATTAPPAAGGSESAKAAEAGPDAAIAAIRETFGRVAAAGDEAAAYFYAWLFLRRPELRTMFPPAMDEQRDRLFRSLARIVESLSTPEEMASYLSQLGRDHRKYSVEPAMYDAVGEALIATLRAFAESAFTPEAEEAWTQTYAAASALMIRAAEEHAAGSPAFWPAEAVEIEDRGNGIAVVTIAPDQVLPYAAGQHITVQTPRWPHVWRPYSIACRPREDGLIRLHVKAVSGGWVSRALVHHTAPGDELVLGPPLGTMTLRAAGRRDLMCVAGGTGLAPVKALAEQLATLDEPPPTALFFGARRAEALYDLADLEKLSAGASWLTVTPCVSGDPGYPGERGTLPDVVARSGAWAGHDIYLAGPTPMIEATTERLALLGAPPDQMYVEDFGWSMA